MYMNYEYTSNASSMCLLLAGSLLSSFFSNSERLERWNVCTCSVGHSWFLAISVWKMVKNCDWRSAWSGECRSSTRKKWASAGGSAAPCCSSVRQWKLGISSHIQMAHLSFKKLLTNEWFWNSVKLVWRGVRSFAKAAQERKVAW